MTDDELLILGLCCSDVTSVVISESTKNPSMLTDGGLSRFAQQCSKIRSLTLHDCPHITSGGLAKVLHVCVELETLNLALKEPVSDEMLLELIRRTPHLSRLALVGKTEITKTGVGYLSSQMLKSQ